MVMVFDRVTPSASNQTYSAKTYPANPALMLEAGSHQTINQSHKENHSHIFPPALSNLMHALHQQSCPSQVTQLLKERNLAKADAPPSLPLSTFRLIHGVWEWNPFGLLIQCIELCIWIEVSFPKNVRLHAYVASHCVRQTLCHAYGTTLLTYTELCPSTWTMRNEV